MFKRFLMAFMVGVGLYAGLVFAGDITPTGESQADRYTFFTEVRDRFNGLLHIIVNHNGTVSDPNIGISASSHSRVNATSAFTFLLPSNVDENATASYTRQTGADVHLSPHCNATETNKWGAWYITVNASGGMDCYCSNGTGNTMNFDTLALAEAAQPEYSLKSNTTLVAYVYAQNASKCWNGTVIDIASSKYKIVDKHLFNDNSTLKGL